ncbi:hypothetical protein [Micromonospora sp. NPDC093277]|uniref:hypothetical protein n=1 Tax=Micromonospora sp. NPDC093277 TaxID=3364291 RepID=UPI0038214E13
MSPGPPRGVPRWLSVAATIVGTLTALISFGLLTWLVVLGYAIWRRSWRNGLAAAYYLAMGLTFVIVVGGSETEEVSETEGYLLDRRLRGPFGSMEELAARCLLPPALTDSLRDRLVFFPPMADPASSGPRDG